MGCVKDRTRLDFIDAVGTKRNLFHICNPDDDYRPLTPAGKGGGKKRGKIRHVKKKDSGGDVKRENFCRWKKRKRTKGSKPKNGSKSKNRSLKGEGL